MTRVENQMRSPSYSTQFHRDVKRLQKRGKDLEKLKKLIEFLLAGASAVQVVPLQVQVSCR